jgi:hypothetical protein
MQEWGADGLPLVGELPEDDVEHLDGLLRRAGLPAGDELAEVVQVGARGELDGDPVLPLAAGAYVDEANDSENTSLLAARQMANGAYRGGTPVPVSSSARRTTNSRASNGSAPAV